MKSLEFHLFSFPLKAEDTKAHLYDSQNDPVKRQVCVERVQTFKTKVLEGMRKRESDATDVAFDRSRGTSATVTGDREHSADTVRFVDLCQEGESSRLIPQRSP